MIPDDAGLVGISVTVDVLPQAIELAKVCRERRVPVVVGGIGVASAPMPRPYFDATRDRWGDAVRVFADSRRYPIYFHCWGGADRTGQLAFLLEGLCGVSEGDLCIDYELSTFGGFARVRCPNELAKRGFFDLLDRVKVHPGAELADKFAAFFEDELGIAKHEIAAIRHNLMDRE